MTTIKNKKKRNSSKIESASFKIRIKEKANLFSKNSPINWSSKTIFLVKNLKINKIH
jgi:hypothetical protein